MTDHEIFERQSPSDPMVSVVIPCFNRAHTISKALDSVLSQTYKSFEVIVVDDASTDFLENVVRPYEVNGVVRLIRHATNRGVSGARNTGIQHARGRFVAFLDSDDYWLPEKLKCQVRAAQRSGNEENVICLAKTRILMPGGWTRLRPLRWPERGELLSRYLYAHGGFAQCSSFFISTSLAAKVRFNEDLRQYEDHLFLIEAQAKGGELVTLNDELVVWVNDTRPDRLSSVESVQRVAQFIEIASKTVDERTLKAFEARTTCDLVWRQSRIRALLLLVEASIGGGLSVKQAVMLCVRMIVPHKAFERVKKFLTVARA